MTGICIFNLRTGTERVVKSYLCGMKQKGTFSETKR